jgi:hypothetical protein
VYDDPATAICRFSTSLQSMNAGSGVNSEMTPMADEQPTLHMPSWVVWGLLVVGLLLLFFVLPHRIEGDRLVRFGSLQSLLAGHGVPDTKYPVIGSLPAIPLMLLGRVVASPEWWVSHYNVIVYAAGLALLYLLLRGRVAGDVLGTFLLLLGTTAMLPFSLIDFGAETFNSMAVATGLAAWSIGRWKTATVLLGVGVANQPATFVGLSLAMGWWAWRFKRVRALAPLVLSAGLWMLENTVRRQSPFSTGYDNDHSFHTVLPYSGLPGFSYPPFYGVLSLLLSFGKGLLFFAPGLVLVFGRGLEALKSLREILVMWMLYLAGMVLVYAHWWAWFGGFTWGPRFLTFASVPAALLLAAQVRRPARTLLALTVVLAALVFSAWVGIDGQTFGRFRQDVCSANNYYLESYCWYLPEFSVLYTPFVFHAHVTLRDAILIAYAAGVTIYVAYPLLREWALTVYRDLQLTLAAYRRRASWRF